MMKNFMALMCFFPATVVTALAAWMEYSKNEYWGFPFAVCIFLWLAGLAMFDKKS